MTIPPKNVCLSWHNGKKSFTGYFFFAKHQTRFVLSELPQLVFLAKTQALSFNNVVIVNLCEKQV